VTVRVGLIGFGGFGRLHARCYAALAAEGRDLTLSAVAAHNAESRAAAAALGAELYGSGEELIARADVDLVDICVPTDRHAALLLAALERGLPVVTEKPVTRRPDELDAVVAAQQAGGVPVGVALCLRFWEEYAWLHDAVVSGRLGAPRCLTLARAGAAPAAGWYLDAARSGSVGLDLHIHDVDVLAWLFGRPDEVLARGSYDSRGTCRQILTSYRFGEVVATAEAAWFEGRDHPFAMGYRASFERGEAVFASGRTPSLVVYPADGEAYAPALAGRDAYVAELDHLTRCVAAGRDFGLLNLAEALPAMALAFEELRQVPPQRQLAGRPEAGHVEAEGQVGGAGLDAGIERVAAVEPVADFVVDVRDLDLPGAEGARRERGVAAAELPDEA
jgi:predicted dehydrogenase